MKQKLIPVIIISCFLIGILATKSSGIWKTESSKVPKKIVSGEFEGEFDPADIRGSYYLKNIQDNFEVKAVTIVEAFSIATENPEEFQVKELEKIYGELEEGIEIGTSSVRKFVALYTGLPYEDSHDSVMPKMAVEILYREQKITEEERVELMKNAINLSNIKTIKMVDNNIEEHDSNVIEVKGKTTVEEVLSYGVKKEELEKMLGITIEDKNKKVRDICVENSIEFSVVKEQLNKMLKDE